MFTGSSGMFIHPNLYIMSDERSRGNNADPQDRRHPQRQAHVSDVCVCVCVTLFQVRVHKRRRGASSYFWTGRYDSSPVVWSSDVSRCVTPLIVTLTYPKPSPAPELSADLR